MNIGFSYKTKIDSNLVAYKINEKLTSSTASVLVSLICPVQKHRVENCGTLRIFLLRRIYRMHRQTAPCGFRNAMLLLLQNQLAYLICY